MENIIATQAVHKINLVLDDKTARRVGEDKISEVISEVDAALGADYTDEIVDISSIFHILLIFGKSAYKMIHYGVLSYERGAWELNPDTLKAKSITGLKVKNARKHLGISPEEMSGGLGMSVETFKHKENGDADFSESEIESLAVITGLDIGYFREHNFEGIKKPDKIFVENCLERLRMMETANKHRAGGEV